MATATTITVGPANNRRSRRKVDAAALWSEAGLAVTRSFERPGWTITHLASGYAVKQGIGRQRDAIIVARRLLDAGDWTRTKAEVTSDWRLKDRARDILTEARLLGLVK
jgi:hypothetical protein